MLPFQKAHWLLGCSGIAMIMEQDRKHWLLKTDKLKQVQDTVTGHMFQGQLDNTGTEINIETKKFPNTHNVLASLEFSSDELSQVLVATSSALPFADDDTNMACVRLQSTEYQYDPDTKKNFKLKFTNATQVTIPIRTTPNGTETLDVPFIKTTTPPTLEMLDSNEQFTISVPITFSTTMTNVEYYYPLAEFKPFDLDELGGDVYEFESLITDEQSIGYPIFWFISDELKADGGTTHDVGYAGIQITSNSVSGEYPYNLNEWDGLPEWMLTNTDSQRLVVYAIHETPTSDEDPTTKQTAALLFDPGVPSTENSEDLPADSIGRVYVLSNDDIDYHNNNLEEHPKPPRTVARICDVPTSVMQLTNLAGIAPTPVVDKKYVRSEASYTDDDQEKLYNGITSDLWVRPTHLKMDGTPVYDPDTTENNEFVFQTLEGLNSIDLMNYNDFREYENLNQMVPTESVEVVSIVNPGSGYVQDDSGTIVIGGFGYIYTITEVTDGVVTGVTIAGKPDVSINLSNFDMLPGTSGLTQVYGTSPLTGSGSGLRLQFQIQNYESLLPRRGGIRSGLFAFVRRDNGLWMYGYDKTNNSWKQVTLISEYEVSDPTTAVTMRDAYLNSIIASTRIFPISEKAGNQAETSIKVLSTASCVNVIDPEKIPLTIPIAMRDPSDTRTIVDLNKYVCYHIETGVAQQKTHQSVIDYFRQNNRGRFGCYLIWRWVTNDPTDRTFEYGFVYLSFNNLQSTDNTTFLPSNDLVYKKFVNTNPSTTLIWDVKGIGPMMWTFNPDTFTQESYELNADTRDLYVIRRSRTWKNVQIWIPSTHTLVSLYDTNGKLKWNIDVGLYDGSGAIQTPIYRQPEYTAYPMHLNIGCDINDIPDYLQPKGGWQLIFPRIESFSFRNDETESVYTPIRLNVIRGNVTNTTQVMDSQGNLINAKTMIIDDRLETSSIKVYNEETGLWTQI